MGKYYLGTGTQQINFQVVDSTGVVSDLNLSGLYLSITGKAADADKLDNFDSSYFRNAANLTGAYTGQISGSIANADTLDGYDSSYFLNGANITGFISGNVKINYLNFTTGLNLNPSTAQVTWTDTPGTMSVGLLGGNVDLNVGFQSYEFVTNRGPSTLTKGTVVYVSGAQGNRPVVAPAIGIADSSSAATFGLMAENLATMSDGYAITQGLLTNLNTTGFAEGASLYLSPTISGGITSIKPQAPQHSVLIGFCVRSHQAAGEILVKIQNGVEIDELHDVRISNVKNNDILRYNLGSGLWYNSDTLALNGTGSHYVSGNLGIGTSSPSGRLQVDGAAIVTGNLTVDNGTLFVDAVNDRVGVGTTSPNTKLHVAGNAIINDLQINTAVGGGPASTFTFQSNTASGVNDAFIFNSSRSGGNYGNFEIQKTGTAKVHVGLGSLDPNTYFNIDGNFGVGTTSPSYKFDVAGTANAIAAKIGAASQYLTIGSYTPNSAGATLGYNTTQYLGLNAFFGVLVGRTYVSNTSTAPADGMAIQGNLGVGTTAPGGKLEVNFTAATAATALILRTSDSAGNGAIRWQNSAGTNQAGIGSSFNVADTGAIEFLNGATTNVIFRSSGNVGIGTTNPTTLLHVNGAATFAGAINLSASGQTNAKQIITNTDSASYSHFNLVSGVSQTATLYQFGSTYTTAGRYIQGSAVLETGGAGGLNLATSAATPIRFYTNGDNLRLTIDSTGAATFAGAVTVNGTGTSTISSATTGAAGLMLRNTAAGAGNYGILGIGNDSDANAFNIITFSSTYSGSGANTASFSRIENNRASAGLNLVAGGAGGTVNIYAGGEGAGSKVATFSSTLDATFAGAVTSQISAANTANYIGVLNGSIRGIQLGVTSANNISWQFYNGSVWQDFLTGNGGTLAATFAGAVNITGNLTVNGTTTTVNSTTVTVDDPIITLGGDTAPTVDDNKDRGVEFRWHNGTIAKIGFFGFDDSTGYLTFIPDATNTSEVFSGSVGDIQAANFRGTLIGSLSNALTAGSYLTGTSYNGSAAVTFAVDATSVNTVSKVVARDASGNFSAGTITAALSGNATTATTLQTARNIAGVSFNGSADISITGQNITNSIGTAANDIEVAKYMRWKNYGNSHVLIDTSAGTSPTGSAVDKVTPGFPIDTTTGVNSWGNNISLMGWNGSSTYGVRVDRARNIDNQANSATITAATANTASTIVLRDASGNFSAGAITASSLTGPASTNLTLAGGSTGASLVLGQGATASTLTSTGINQWLLLNNTAASNGYTFRSARQGTTFGIYHTTLSIALGTVSNHPLDFLTFDGSTQMRLATTGNLLIGTTTDISGTGGLHVAGTGTATSSSNGGALRVGTNVAMSGNAGGASYFGGNIVARAALGYATGIHSGATADSSQQLILSSSGAYSNAYVSKNGTTLGIGFSSSNGSFVEDNALSIVAATKAATFAGAVSASNLSGTNTGDQTVGNGALTLAVSGTGLSGSASFTANQSGATTFTVTSNATSSNTASTIVARDASGNFSAGAVTASFLDISGNSTQNVGLARFTNNYAAGGVYYPTASFIQTRGAHSYGIVSEFRTNTAGDSDRPSILFYGAQGAHSWQVGQITSGWGAVDNFGIGYRASNTPSSFPSWPTNYFTITTGGNVGIGQTSPSYKLEVETGVGDSNGIRVRDSATGVWMDLRRRYIECTGGDFWINSQSSSFDLRTANSSRLFIALGGNVGIGTTSPGGKLVVNGDVGIGGDPYYSAKLTVDGNSITAGSVGIAATRGGPVTTLVNDGGTSATSKALKIINSSGSALATFEYGGNVGIGTTTPGYKLEVNGSFAATTKSFVIHHPTKKGKKLRYGSLEGPENGVYIRGKTTSKVIELPDYWTKLVDPESISVQLTAIGSHQKLYVEKIENNKVYIANENLLAKSINCFFYILAERADVEKLQVEIDA